MHWRYHYFTSVYQKSWYDLQFWRYKVLQIEIGNYGSFFALLSPLPWKPKKSEFQKNKDCWRYHHFTHVHHHHFTHVYQNPPSYELWFLKYGVRDNNFFVILGHFFCPFTPLTTWKIKILNKQKKHAKNYNRITYASWDKECNRHNFLSFCAIFAILPHYWPQKLKFGKNVKKPWDIILLNMRTINEDHMMYDSWDIRYEGQSFLSIWAIFWTLTLLTTSEFWKNFKKHVEILSFYTCVPQMRIIWCMVPEIWSVTDRIFCHFVPFLPFYSTIGPKN